MNAFMRTCFSCFCILVFCFTNARGEEEQKPKSIGLTAEWIELELKELPRLLRKHGGSKESSALYAEVEKLLEEGKAEQVEVVYTRSRFGERLKAGSYEEYIYPTEYDPPEIPGTVTLTETGGDAVPMTGATPTAFETRNVGVTVEADSYIGDDGNISLVLAAEDVRFLERDYHINPEVKESRGHKGVWMPKFYTMKVTSELLFETGGVVLAGTFTPPEPDKAKKRLLLFIRVQPITSNAPNK